MIPIRGLAEIASDYDGMLIDQFGVLHDGSKLYPGALDVLERLHQLNIPVAVMTNSGKRTGANIARLTKMGIPRTLYVDAVSSGEVAYAFLKSSPARRAFIIGKEGEDYGFDRFEFVEQPAWRLARAEKQESAGLQREMKQREHRFLRMRLQIDKEVPTRNQIELGER